MKIKQVQYKKAETFLYCLLSSELALSKWAEKKEENAEIWHPPQRIPIAFTMQNNRHHGESQVQSLTLRNQSWCLAELFVLQNVGMLEGFQFRFFDRLLFLHFFRNCRNQHILLQFWVIQPNRFAKLVDNFGGMFMLLAREVLSQKNVLSELAVKHCALFLVASGLDPIQYWLFIFLNCHGSSICFHKESERKYMRKGQGLPLLCDIY